jgi:hypothetical protein
MFKLIQYIQRQRAWSKRTFGPGKRTVGLKRHILKELAEITAEPESLEEWVDVVILALDGAWRAGHNPAEIVAELQRKQSINFKREWPPPGPQHNPTEYIRHRCKGCGFPVAEGGAFCGECACEDEAP